MYSLLKTQVWSLVRETWPDVFKLASFKTNTSLPDPRGLTTHFPWRLMTIETDKASLLAEVIDHVKDLKRRASEITQVGPIPTDVDELKVEADGAIEEGKIFIKASLCCDDRPDLMSDLIQTFQTLGLRTVKAEMSTLAGRVKNVFLVTDNEKVFEEIQTKPSINSIEEALKTVMERTAASGELSAGSSISNKRQRILPFEA